MKTTDPCTPSSGFLGRLSGGLALLPRCPIPISRETERPRLVVVRKQLGISPPVDDAPQSLIGVASVQMVLKLELESIQRRVVIFTVIENLPDMGDERYEAKEMLFEEALAIFSSALGEDTTSCSQLDRTVFQFSEFEDVQSRSNRKKIINLEGKRLGDLSQFGMPSVCRRGQGFDEPADAINRNVRQSLNQSAVNLALGANRLRHPRGQDRVDLIHNGAKRSIEPVARLGQWDPDLGSNVPWV
jgi:hypothetical protein